jgi:hypothetical protein
MLEGIYFQFPKLGFLLFFFLACETLCPLRSNALYFPNTTHFGEAGVKPLLWMWLSKWGMISLFIVALMSPVKDQKITYYGGGGYDILLILDPAMIDRNVIAQVDKFIDKRPNDGIGLWVPGRSEVSIPLTYEHDVLKSILSQIPSGHDEAFIGPSISRFFNASLERAKWVIVISPDPQKALYPFPSGIEASYAPQNNRASWFESIHHAHPVLIPQQEHRYVDYFYIYPLFFGFMAMLSYLYGRNQKGLK